MKTLFLFFLLAAGMLQGNAQELYASLEREAEKPVARDVDAVSYTWEFYSALRDYSAHSYAKADAQVFGKDIACLLALLDEKFVRKEQVAAGDPALQAAIRKPLVYNSVKNIAKYYRQKRRNGGFTPADAELLAHVVKVALACVEEDSAEFEKALKQSKKNREQQLDCFRKVKLRALYE